MSQDRSVFHTGETAIQDCAGVPARTRDMAARAIRNAMPERHRAFFAALPLVFLALLDRRGRPWAIPFAGPPGCVTAPSSRRLVLRQEPPLATAFALGTSLGAGSGLIGLDFATCRRNWANGRILSSGETLTVTVKLSFGDCPKYIQTRAFDPSHGSPPLPRRRPAALTDDTIRRHIAATDTFLAAARGADTGSDGLDVSHRGGRPGFLKIGGNGTVSFPDFAGNRYLNTLGKIAGGGRVGLFVPGFDSGAAALATGRATIDWSVDRIARIKGAERMIVVVPDELRHVEHALPSRARLIEAWPGLAQTGTWRTSDPHGPRSLVTLHFGGGFHA